MSRVTLTHLEFRNVQSYDRGPTRETESRDVQSWNCELDDGGELTTLCQECQAPLRVRWMGGQEFASARRRHRREGAKMLTVCATLLPFGVLSALLSAAASHPIFALTFVIGVLFAFMMSAGVIGGLVMIIGRPSRCSIVEQGEPQTQPTQGWRVSHKIRPA